jgi:hypothetical protein
MYEVIYVILQFSFYHLSLHILYCHFLFTTSLPRYCKVHMRIYEHNELRVGEFFVEFVRTNRVCYLCESLEMFVLVHFLILLL